MKFVTPILFLLCATTVCTSALHVNYFERQGRRLQLLQTQGLFEQGQGNFFPFSGPIERAPWQLMNINQPQFSPEVFPVDNGISGGFGNVAEAAPLPATSVDEQGVNSAEATLVAAPAPVAATGDGQQPSNTVHSPKLSDSSGISMSSGSGSIVRSVGDLRKNDPSVGEETPKTKTSVARSLKSHSLAAIVTLYLMVTFMS